MASARQRRKIRRKKKTRKTNKIRATTARMRTTMIKLKVVRRRQTTTTARSCGVCGSGEEQHGSKRYCAYNYILDGRFSLGECREVCRPGDHTPERHQRESLRRLVRVTNVPLDLVPDTGGRGELRNLFARFGPILKIDIKSRGGYHGSRGGFGYVAFEERRHAEEAIDRLNGHLVGDRKLRVDWAYPRA